MKNFKAALSVSIIGFIAALFFMVQCSPRQVSERHLREIENTLLGQVHSFCGYIDNRFLPAATASTPDPSELQHHFLKTRLLFKELEWAAEYFMGATTDMVNGPPVPKVENADLLDKARIRTINPSGLQVIEEFLFPEYNADEHENLLSELDFLQLNCHAYKNYFSSYPLTDWRVLDAAKLEVFRILTTGIVGFDNPLTLDSMAESAAALKSVRTIIAHYVPDDEGGNLLGLMDTAVSYLSENRDFDSFNRAAFITEFGNPISAGIAVIEQSFGYPIKYNRMLRQEAGTLFDENAFNVNAFAPGQKWHATPGRAALGERLFFDNALSGPGTRSCATCHLPALAFTDGLAKNTNIYDGKTPLPRNTPTLLNVAFQSNYFHDMRALTLEDQANAVIHNPDEMDGSLEKIVRYLRENKEYVRMFEAAYPGKGKEAVDSLNVLNALASYQRVHLSKLNSRFDEFMRGDMNALTPQEVDGFNIYMGKAKCATCHFMPLFNGVQPPKFVESDAEIIGIPASASDSTLDTDLGWYEIIGEAAYKHAFKTPTVRNVTDTAPYMHNGVHKTLEEVMEFYNNAGPVGLGFEVENMTLPEDSLFLSQDEIDAVVAFMKSLDSKMD